MEMTSAQRVLLAESLRSMIEEKEEEIEEINEKTEADYAKLIRMSGKLNRKPFSLELAKEKEIQKVRVAISELRKLDDLIVGGNHRILAVPNYIRLNLGSE